MDGFYRGSPLGLHMLQAEDAVQDQFFFSLPKEIQKEINLHRDEFASEEDLQEFAQRLLDRRGMN